MRGEDVLTNIVVVIIFQYMDVSNHYIAHLTLTQYYVNNVSKNW